MAITFLIVEDEPVIRRYIAASLTKLGHEVVGHAADGEEALKKAFELKPDMILMDINLGEGMNGIEAAANIHLVQDTPIIYLTAYANDELFKETTKTEPYGYVIKPFQERELHIVIEIGLFKYRIEKKLQAFNENRFMATLNSVADAVITTNEAGTIDFMNYKAEELTGWSKDEAADKQLMKVFHVIHENTRDLIENPVEQINKNGGVAQLKGDYLLISNDGEEDDISGTATLIHDDKGNKMGAVIVFR